MLIVVAAAVAASVTLDFSRTVATREPLIVGVVSGPAPAADSFAMDLSARLKEFGIPYARNNDYYDDRLDMEGVFNCGGSTYPSWEGCSPEDSTRYSWGPSDALMEAMRAGGIEPMLRLGGEWQNGGRSHQFKGPQNPTQEHNWIVAATKVAERYRGQYRYLDVWTEFPGEHFWDRQPREFLGFWADAFQAVKHAVPDAKVGGPGFAEMVTHSMVEGRNRSVAETFLMGLYDRKLRPDWLGWHFFSNDPSSVFAADQAYRDLLDGTGRFSRMPWSGTGFFKDTELVCDAFGTAQKAGANERLDEATLLELHNGARGAATVAAELIALQGGSTSRAYFYRAGDPRAVPGGVGENAGGLGLFYADPGATPKKNAYAIRLFTTMLRTWPTVRAVHHPSVTGPWAALTSNGSGGFAVFLANPSDDAVTVDSKGAFRLGTSAGVREWLVDATHDGQDAATLPTGPVTLPAWSVALLTTGP